MRSNSLAYCRCDKSRSLKAISTWDLNIPRYWDCEKSLHHLLQCLINFAEKMFFSCLSVICLISFCAHPFTEKSLAFFLQSLSAGIYGKISLKPSLLQDGHSALLASPCMADTPIPSPSSWPLTGYVPVAPRLLYWGLRTPDVSHYNYSALLRGKDHLPQPAGNTLSNAAQDGAGLP